MKGELIRPAVCMAIKDVEKKGLLSGYRLQLLENDTQVRTDLLDMQVKTVKEISVLQVASLL